MADANNPFAERYRNKSARELARLAAEEDNLVPEAREALRIEIARRPQPALQAPAPAQATAPAEAPVPATDNLDGVRGWLFLYSLGLIIVSVRLTISALAMAINGGVPLVAALVFLGLVGWNVATAVALFRRARSALGMVSVQLILTAAIVAISLGARIALHLFSNESEGAAVPILTNATVGAETIIWYRYFCVSKRVRINFGRNL